MDAEEEGERGSSDDCEAARWGSGGGRLWRGKREGKCAGGFSVLGVEGGVNVRVDDIGEGRGDSEVASHGGVGMGEGADEVSICFWCSGVRGLRVVGGRDGDLPSLPLCWSRWEPFGVELLPRSEHCEGDGAGA